MLVWSRAAAVVDPTRSGLRAGEELDRGGPHRQHGGAARLPTAPELDDSGPVGEVISLWLATAGTGAQLTHRLINRLEDVAFSMAGDPGSPTRRPARPAE
ncbi:hypothetical protein [Nocardiopsis coralliicola]